MPSLALTMRKRDEKRLCKKLLVNVGEINGFRRNR
jgi:hypothetical protein